MIGGLIVTHGRLAIELLNAAETIVGEIHSIAAVSLGWQDDVDTAAAMIQKALERVKAPGGILVLTDMFGGTPTNIASTFLDPGKVEIVTGVNLPMVIKLAHVIAESLAEPDDAPPLSSVARKVSETGQGSIYIASDLLAPRTEA